LSVAVVAATDVAGVVVTAGAEAAVVVVNDSTVPYVVAPSEFVATAW
jgi:hypothetical protein